MRWVISAWILCNVLACSHFQPLADNRIPQPGWDYAEVRMNLGASGSWTTTADGLDIWRYGIARWYRFVQPSCSRDSEECLSVIFQDGKVINVVRSNW